VSLSLATRGLAGRGSLSIATGGVIAILETGLVVPAIYALEVLDHRADVVTVASLVAPASVLSTATPTDHVTRAMSAYSATVDVAPVDSIVVIMEV